MACYSVSFTTGLSGTTIMKEKTACGRVIEWPDTNLGITTAKRADVKCENCKKVLATGKQPWLD